MIIWLMVIVGVLVVIARLWFGRRAALALVAVWLGLVVLGGVFGVGIRR